MDEYRNQFYLKPETSQKINRLAKRFGVRSRSAFITLLVDAADQLDADHQGQAPTQANQAEAAAAIQA